MQQIDREGFAESSELRTHDPKSSSDVLLAVDAGTSVIKTVAFDTAGNELAHSAEENTILRPSPRRTEQGMETTWSTTVTTINATLAALPDDATLLGIGITAQGNGCWPVDTDGKPVRNAILWSDSRAADLLDQWETDGQMKQLVDRCGSIPYPGMSLPIIAWLANEEPKTFDRIETVLSCKDWLTFRLTGNRATDLSEATVPYIDSATGTFGSEPFCIVGFPEADGLVPSPEPATNGVGTVTERAAAETGLPVGLPVVSSAIDVVAAAIGSGATESGQGAITLGTSLSTQVLTTEPQSERSGIQMALGIEDLWTYAIGSNAGTASLEWALDTIGPGWNLEELEREAATAPVGSRGLLYHPYLSSTGERGPFVNPTARAQFIGLSPEHTSADLARAIYEGLSLAIRDCVEALPTDLTVAHLSGGGTNSTFWCQLVANCLDTELIVSHSSEIGARGAAITLGLAVGEYSDLMTASDRIITPSTRYIPRHDAVNQYERLYNFYRETRERMDVIWSDREKAFSGL